MAVIVVFQVLFVILRVMILSMQFVFYLEMITLDAPIACRVFRGVTECKLMGGSAAATAIVPGYT